MTSAINDTITPQMYPLWVVWTALTTSERGKPECQSAPDVDSVNLAPVVAWRHSEDASYVSVPVVANREDTSIYMSTASFFTDRDKAQGSYEDRTTDVAEWWKMHRATGCTACK